MLIVVVLVSWLSRKNCPRSRREIALKRFLFQTLSVKKRATTTTYLVNRSSYGHECQPSRQYRYMQPALVLIVSSYWYQKTINSPKSPMASRANQYRIQAQKTICKPISTAAVKCLARQPQSKFSKSRPQPIYPFTSSPFPLSPNVHVSDRHQSMASLIQSGSGAPYAHSAQQG
jgi:hypothetical protein